MRKALLPVLLLLAALAAAVGAEELPYDPAADAWADLERAGAVAREHDRLVLAVVGGNWCRWCRALDRLMTEDATVRAAVEAGFEVVRVSYSRENRNETVLEKLRRPDKLGFPVLVVLSPNLEVLRHQSTEGFETGDPNRPGHDPAKLVAFFSSWRPARR